MLSLGVFVLFINEGVKHHGPIGYLKSLMPGGLKGPIVLLIFPIEILSIFLRLISLTVRLWANLLAGHLLIAFMGGTLGVLVGLQLVSWFLLPAGIADLPVRGRADRRPAGLHLCHLDRHLHRRSGRVPLDDERSPTMLHALNAVFARRGNPSNTVRPRAGRSRSASARAAAPPVRAPASDAVFNASIQSKTRQPELRADIERDQWLGFALTEAVFFYGLVGGFIAFFL